MGTHRWLFYADIFALRPLSRERVCAMDDGLLIFENPAIRAINLSTLTTIFTTYDPELYIPFTFFTYQIDFQLGGIEPVIYHAQNLFWHTINALLALWFAWLLVRDRWVALGTGLLFAIHPLHTEAVAWASARKDVLSAAFFLLSLCLYIRSHERQSARTYWLSVVSFAFALMAKVTIITLPVTLLLVDVVLQRPFHKKMLLDKIPYGVLSVVFGIIAVIGKTGVLERSEPIETMLMAFRSTVFYLQKMILPTELSVLYPYVGDIRISNPDFFIPIALCLLMIVAVALSVKYTRLIVFGFLFFLVTIAPTFVNFAKGGLDIYFASDRYAYAGSIGIFLLACAGVRALYSRYRSPVIPGLCTIVLITLGVLSFRQSMVWANTDTLFSNVIEHYPQSHVAHTNIGNVLRRKGQVSEAIEHYNDALAIRTHSQTLSNLGSAYRQLGQIDQALRAYEQALESNPQSHLALTGLGVVAAERGEFDRAEDYYTQALAINPRYLEAQVNLGALYAAMQQYDDALVEYDKALAISPYYPQTHYNKAIALEKMSRMRESLESYMRAVELAPTFTAARINLGIVLANRGDIDAAIEQFRAVLEIDPSNARAQSALQQLDAL